MHLRVVLIFCLEVFSYKIAIQGWTEINSEKYGIASSRINAVSKQRVYALVAFFVWAGKTIRSLSM